MHHNLGAHLSGWLQQNRIHVRGSSYAEGFGLHPLGAADFPAVFGNIGIQRHVL
ncbi:hypothetical protein D3C80_1927790 [compost metagenome]